MSFQPQGFLFQPSLALHSFGSGLLLGPRTEELGRSSSGSAFAPYSGPTTSSGLNSHLPYGGEPRTAATLSAFMGAGYDPSSGLSGSLDCHPFRALGPYPYSEASFRKSATRDATATLKAWLHEHRKNPYPTKGEKIMLAIITKMTLTQVSTWFANARRRLKKENKMTWTPRTRSEDEEEEDHIIELEQNDEMTKTSSDAGVHQTSSLADHGADLDSRGQRSSFVPGAASTMSPPALHCPPPPPPPPPLQESRLPEACKGQGPNVAPKPKLWSLAEMALSSDQNKGCSDSPQTPVPHHLYCSSPCIPGYMGPLGSLARGPSPSRIGGLQQQVALQRGEATTRDCSTTT